MAAWSVAFLDLVGILPFDLTFWQRRILANQICLPFPRERFWYPELADIFRNEASYVKPRDIHKCMVDKWYIFGRLADHHFLSFITTILLRVRKIFHLKMLAILVTTTMLYFASALEIFRLTAGAIAFPVARALEFLNFKK
jgi:hypothetical protein